MTNNPLALAARISRHLSDIEKVVNRCKKIYEECFTAVKQDLHNFCPVFAAVSQ